MVRSWCDSAKSFHVVPVYTVQWKFIWRIFSFLSFISDEKIHQISYIRTQPWPMTCKTGGNLVKRRQNCMGVYCMDGQQTRPLVYAGSYTSCCGCEGGGPSTKFTLRSWCNLVKWPYGVKKISIKWLLPGKVTLEVIKRHPKDFADLVMKTL